MLHFNLSRTFHLLTEDIDSVKRRYPMVDDDLFAHILALDPTYREGSNSVGTYTKWMLNLAKNNKFDEEVDYVGPDGSEMTSHIDQLLAEFERKKPAFANKDIGQFKTVKDLAVALANTGEPELTARQKERRMRTSKDYKQVFSGKDFDIFIPLTYAGSCTLGKGTNWCTAYSADDSYYKEYTSRGPLYILINKHNPSDKYQFFFPQKQFMNKEDKPINIKDFYVANPDIQEFFDNLLYEIIYEDESYKVYRDTVANIPYLVLVPINQQISLYSKKTVYYDMQELASFESTSSSDLCESLVLGLLDRMSKFQNILNKVTSKSVIHELFASLQWWASFTYVVTDVEIAYNNVYKYDYLDDTWYYECRACIPSAGDTKIWINPAEQMYLDLNDFTMHKEENPEIRRPFKHVIMIHPEAINTELHYGCEVYILIDGESVAGSYPWTFIGMYNNMATFVYEGVSQRFTAQDCIKAIKLWERE